MNKLTIVRAQLEESGIINHNHYFLRQSIILKKVHTTKSGTIDVRAKHNYTYYLECKIHASLKLDVLKGAK